MGALSCPRRSGDVEDGMFIAQLISQTTIMAMLYHLEPMGPYVPHYQEIATAVTKAANEQPLFPQHESGSQATAAILISLAWYESRFHTNVVGDNGKSFGLFQIQPPTAKVDGKLLLLPMNAAFIATDLVRESFRQCEKRPWTERLSWYVSSNGCPKHPIIVKKSMERLMLAQQLFAKFFPKSELPPALPPKTEK